MNHNPPKDGTPKEKKVWFQSNVRYFSISIYALCVIALGTIIIYSIINWSLTKTSIQNVIHILSPFFIGFFIAFILNPLMNSINKFLLDKVLAKSKSAKKDVTAKALSLLLSYLIFFGIIVIILIYVIPQFITSIQDLTENIPAMFNVAYDYISNLQERYPNLDLYMLQERINELKPQLIDYGTNLVTNVFPLIYNISVSIVRTLINIILSLVISAYLLYDKEMLIRNVKRLVYAIFSKERSAYIVKTAAECNNIFSGFIVGKLIDSLIIGVLCFILMLILKLPYGILLSTIVGITNMIPYFGPFIGAVPGIIIYLLIHPIQAVIFTVMILVLQQFDGLYLGPKILGESTGLKPIWVIFAITVGGAYFGVIGMFLGVPVVAVIAFLLNQFLNRKLKSKNITNL